jgi:hypothetical protein
MSAGRRRLISLPRSMVMLFLFKTVANSEKMPT